MGTIILKISRVFYYVKRRLIRNPVVYKLLRHKKFIVELPYEQALRELQGIRPFSFSRLPQRKREWARETSVDISIIVPCYKVAHYLPACLDSIVQQETTYSYEIIAVDDGSPDECGNILDDYARTYPSIVPIHQENQGISGARNSALKVMNGRAVMFVDSDDILPPGAVETLASSLFNGQADFVTANYSCIDSNGGLKKQGEVPRKHGAPWGRLFKRAVFERLEFPEGLEFEDTVQIMCIDELFSEFYLEESVYWYRFRGDSISNQVQSNTKCVDTFWVVYMLHEWRRQLNMENTQRYLDILLWQFGFIAYHRTRNLSTKQQRIFFLCCCGLFNSIKEFDGLHTSYTSLPWHDIAYALRTKNYALWKYACLAARIE